MGLHKTIIYVVLLFFVVLGPHCGGRTRIFCFCKIHPVVACQFE